MRSSLVMTECQFIDCAVTTRGDGSMAEQPVRVARRAKTALRIVM
jgi:hypothetical protein